MKDQTRDVPIKDFEGLKSKIYTFITKENHESEKTKCINKKFADDELKKRWCQKNQNSGYIQIYVGQPCH